MTEFKSNTVSIGKSDQEVYRFFINFNNFEKLMPEQVTNWQSTEDRCSFTIQGMATLEMAISEKSEYSNITYSSQGSSPLDFALHFDISSKELQTTEVLITLKAELNPMLKMMASRPLQNFVNIMAEKLPHVFE